MVVVVVTFEGLENLEPVGRRTTEKVLSGLISMTLPRRDRLAMDDDCDCCWPRLLYEGDGDRLGLRLLLCEALLGAGARRDDVDAAASETDPRLPSETPLVCDLIRE